MSVVYGRRVCTTGLHRLAQLTMHLPERLPASQAAACRGALGLARGRKDRFLISVVNGPSVVPRDRGCRPDPTAGPVNGIAPGR